jgi:hypothetical protein
VFQFLRVEGFFLFCFVLFCFLVLGRRGAWMTEFKSWLTCNGLCKQGKVLRCLWSLFELPSCDEIFWDRVSQSVSPGWLWTVSLLISTSWVARIIGMSHWCLTQTGSLIVILLQFELYTLSFLVSSISTKVDLDMVQECFLFLVERRASWWSCQFQY